MNDKKKLSTLVQIIGDLLKVEGNEWLVDEILKTIGESASIEEISKHSIIQNIHEYCVEEKIEKQAKEFYKRFPFDEIKSQLIQDYQKMEHERRRDDFENFCLCMYQQIENIISYLHEHGIVNNWEINKDKVAYKYPNGERKTQSDIIFGNAKDWYANVKFKAVLFYYYYSEKIKIIIPFNEQVRVFDELYQIRNQNHRGSNPTSFQQRTLDKIEGNESKYYFKFYGFLQDFVSQIEMSSKSENLVSEIGINKLPQERVFKDSLGANNPQLDELRQKMK